MLGIWAAIPAGLYIATWLEIWIGHKTLPPDPLLLKVAGVLIALTLLGMVVKHLIEFEWKTKTTRLEQRVQELEAGNH